VLGSLLAVVVLSVLLAGLARHFDASAPLALVVAGLAASSIPGLTNIELDPDLVLFVLLPPLLWSAGMESSYVGLRTNLRPIGLLAIGLPLATAAAVGFVAYKTVPEMTVAAGLTLGAIVAPPDAVSATAIGRRLGLPRRVMTLLGGESLLNDATALTAYKVALAAAIGAAASWGSGLTTFVTAAVGGVLIGIASGAVITFIRERLDDPLVESAVGLVAPFVIYLAAEEAHGSGVLAVVVAALILAQRSVHAGYETRLQDFAVWKAVQLIFESFAFLLIGLQLPTVVGELAGIRASVIVGSSAAVLATLIVVRIVWVYAFAYLPRALSARIREREVGRYARSGLVGRGVRSAVDHVVGRAVPGAPGHRVPHLRGGDRHAAVARADAAVADPPTRRAERRRAKRCGRRRRRAGAGRQSRGRTARRATGRRGDVRRAYARRGCVAYLEHRAAQLRMGTARPP
jgi:CPA1 family monovalent cation:H+ antiporter